MTFLVAVGLFGYFLKLHSVFLSAFKILPGWKIRETIDGKKDVAF